MKLMILSLLFLSTVSLATVELGLDFDTTEVNQGALAKATVYLRTSEVKKFSPQSLKGKQIAKTLYVQNISPFMGKEGQGFYTADATVVFVKVPEQQSVSETIDGETVTFVWKELKVNPTNAKEFEFSDFDVPGRRHFFLWSVVALTFAGVVLLATKLVERRRRKRELVERRRGLKQKVCSCASYDDVVDLWKEKRLVLAEFTDLEKPFTELEETLFKYQFKRERSAQDIAAVMEAYRRFQSASEGVLHGV